MTIEEIEKLLGNTKVRVDGKSAEIQKKLFSFGYGWCGINGINNKETKHTDAQFLFIYSDKIICYGKGLSYFKEHPNREISADEILSLEIKEPLIKPFVEEINRNEIIENKAIEYATEWVDKFDDGNYKKEIDRLKETGFCEGARWADEHPIFQWNDASLTKPEQDEDAIVLLETVVEGHYKIAFGHIVDKSKCVDYNGWNIEGVKYWILVPKIPPLDK